jgi:hypothetical protein
VPSLHTTSVRAPSEAPGSTVIATSSSVSEITVTASTITPPPAICALDPGRNPVPVTVSAAELPRATELGAIDSIFGIDTART